MRYAMESGQLARLVRLGSTASQYRKFVDLNVKEINLHPSRRGVPITVGFRRYDADPVGSNVSLGVGSRRHHN